IPAAAGSVRIHAATMFPATPHRTAESRLAAPEPITAPEIVWVVESGKPPCEDARITAAPAPCAAKPCAESILWIPLPIVLMVRQREETTGQDLPGAEAARDGCRPQPADDPVQREDRDSAHDEGERRRHQR